MGVLNENAIMGASGVVGGYTIDNSCRFNDDDSPYMTFTPGSAGNRKTFTISFWFKRGNIDAAQHVLCAAASSDKITLYGDYLYADIGGVSSEAASSARTLLRDPSAWYHIVLAVDTTQSTSTNRIKWYLNGSQMTAMTAAFPSLNADSAFNNNTAQRIGTNPSPGYYHDGYISEFHMVDGTALDQTSFGETGDYGEWKPIQYTGSHGTNGYHLDFSNSSALGDDAAGSNDFTVTNITASDQVKDSPTNNFCTMNPLDNYYAGSTFSQGNLGLFITTSAQPTNTANFGMNSGKWYWEVRQGSSGAGGGGAAYQGLLGIAGSLGDASGSALGSHADQYGWYAASSQQLLIGGSYVSYGTNTGYTDGDIISMALDLDNNKMYWAKNGSYLNSGNPAGNSNGYSIMAPSATGLGAYFPAAGDYHSSSENYIFNFGQDGTFAGTETAQGNSDGTYGNFYYAVPSGFKALCTKNIDDPTVIPSEHFNTVLYSGTGSARSITGVGFQPDLHWLKIRTGESKSHMITDAVRGAGKYLQSDGDGAESDDIGTVASFDSDGWSFGGATANQFNNSGSTYAAWNWKAGGAPTADNSAGAGATPTAGSVKIDGANLGSALAGTLPATRMSANTTAGFSITKYAGTGNEVKTVAHGLSVAPNLVIIKRREDSGHGWSVGTIQPLGSRDFTDTLFLHDNSAGQDDSVWWNDTAPSSTVVTIGTNSWVNNASKNFIMYCFHSVEGYSKIGAYRGTMNTDGGFVYLGFRPAWVLIKAMGNSLNWVIFDNKRDTNNPMGKFLFADATNTETTQDPMLDFLSNGMKMRRADSWHNNTYSDGYLYYAIAEQPFKYSNAK